MIGFRFIYNMNPLSSYNLKRPPKFKIIALFGFDRQETLVFFEIGAGWYICTNIVIIEIQNWIQILVRQIQSNW